MKKIALLILMIMMIAFPLGSTPAVASITSNSQASIIANKNLAIRADTNQASSTAANKIVLTKTANPKGLGGGIGKPGPVLSVTKMLDGKRVCRKANDHPAYSKKNPPGHVDGECCLDPDEIPNSLCYYPTAKYGNLLDRYLSKR